MAGVLSSAERVPPTDDELVGAATPGSAASPPHLARFALPATADIRVVTEILALCRRALDAEGDVTVDCADVERVDAAALQCLGALQRSLAEAERLLTFAEPTAAFRRAVDVLGFDVLLGLGAPGPASSP